MQRRQSAETNRRQVPLLRPRQYKDSKIQEDMKKTKQQLADCQDKKMSGQLKEQKDPNAWSCVDEIILASSKKSVQDRNRDK